MTNRHAPYLHICSILILLSLVTIALAPATALAVPQKESSGPLLGDPDGPDQSPSSGPAKAGSIVSRYNSATESMVPAGNSAGMHTSLAWPGIRLIVFFTVIRMTLGW